MKREFNYLALSTIFFIVMSIFVTSCKKDTPEPAQATSIEIVSGNNQTSVIGTTLTNPIIVLVKDQAGNPFKGASIKFETTDDGLVSTATATTDAGGTASVNWELSTTEGSQALTVTAFKADGTTALSGSPLTVTAIGSEVEAVNLVLYLGGGQTQTVGNYLNESVFVKVTDHAGNSFEGTTVNFAVSEGSVSSFAIGEGSVTSTTVITDQQGLAEVGWEVGSTIGEQTLIATTFKADGTTPLEGSPLTISATVEAPTQNSIAIVAGNNQTDEVGSFLSLTILVNDQNGISFKEGVTVNFSVNEGSVTSTTLVTDTQGWAEAGWVLGPTIGEQTLTVTAFKADGTTPLEGSPLVFTATATAAPVSIGDFAYGGVVFYILQPGDVGYDASVPHGFICPISDQSTSAVWGCSLNAIAGADGISIGTGAQNTVDMQAACNTVGTASEVCASLVLNGYSDWFLPSKDELNTLYQNRGKVNTTAINNGGYTFNTSWYYSTSSESSASSAYVKSFAAAGAEGASSKSTRYKIRAIRAF